MESTVTQMHNLTENDAYLSALASWETCKPPYSGSHMRICVTAAKTILKYLGKPRRSKYEKENYLRIDFSKAGKVTIYAEYPKSMDLKGRKLGEWPELTLHIAREKAHEQAKEGLTAVSVHQALDAYIAGLQAKVQRLKLSEHSFYTYNCRIKQLREAFRNREIFSDITYQRLIEVIDLWIETKSNNQAFELFAELRRFWKFAAPLHCGGKNIAASLPDDYISSRVQRPTPTRLFTDIESIAQLWLNVAGCTSIHQKNAIRFMILTGVRPINVTNLRWDYINEITSEIVYPAGLTGMRGAMKTQKEFRLPITPMLKVIIDEQKAWRESVAGCNRDYVFLQPRDITESFSKRSLDKLIKTYSPDNALKGIVHEGTVKGKSGAFNTMCRKFLKSNVIAQMRARGYSRSDTREISQLCMHHSDSRSDPMGEHYDFSDEILQEEIALKRLAFEAHENSIMAQAALLRRKS
ncbi:Site-specific recombinase, phage integrase family [Xenorhabdus poinarii G6]|uniref:Site-specific recombinase, phage integrase family n=1 Tax=Xenorhabdus poinarii G6 TaxID=1354304 RepID=A0A068R0S2_9GAMM|nr:recombinase [Xenorhabdus poinarii]CDG20649.1 Site-specific recombinase, phage integrase family [Xenorhabdus poinarii G6]